MITTWAERLVFLNRDDSPEPKRQEVQFYTLLRAGYALRQTQNKDLRICGRPLDKMSVLWREACVGLFQRVPPLIWLPDRSLEGGVPTVFPISATVVQAALPRPLIISDFALGLFFCKVAYKSVLFWGLSDLNALRLTCSCVRNRLLRTQSIRQYAFKAFTLQHTTW